MNAGCLKSPVPDEGYSRGRISREMPSSSGLRVRGKRPHRRPEQIRTIRVAQGLSPVKMQEFTIGGLHYIACAARLEVEYLLIFIECYLHNLSLKV